MVISRRLGDRPVVESGGTVSPMGCWAPGGEGKIKSECH